MTHDSAKPPESLLQSITRDLSPVKPSPLPFRLTLRMAPLAVLVSSLILLPAGIRYDHGVLGPLLTWGPSVAQFVLAMVLIWMAARESTPASKLPKNVVYFVTGATALILLTIAWLTFAISPTTVSPRVSPLFMGLACGIGSTIAGAILIGLFTLVYRRSLATSPALAGALYGTGAGVAINAGWRLACPVSEPWHALGAHGTAVIATALLGALAGQMVEWRNARNQTRTAS